MKIIIVGCGNVGGTLAKNLSEEGHQISVIDTNADVINDTTNKYDVLGVIGNGVSLTVLIDAGILEADMIVAVTGHDEVNLLSCLMAKQTGIHYTVARVSDPGYSDEFEFMRSELGISMIVNPQYSVAREIAKLLKFPSALEIDTFARSKVDMVTFRLEDWMILCDQELKNTGALMGVPFLVTMITRNGKVSIPSGNFRLQAGDEVSIISQPECMVKFFKKIGTPISSAKSAMIVGAGRTTVYLARRLLRMGMNVTIIDKNMDACNRLAEMVPKALIICGDATTHTVLQEEGIKETGAFVALTNIDEVNIMLSMYAKGFVKGKCITRIHRVDYHEVLDSMQMDSVMYPKFIAASQIERFVRALQAGEDSNIESLYRLRNAEIMEFHIEKESSITGKALKELRFKPNVLVATIKHEGITKIAGGSDEILPGDTIIIVTTMTGVSDVQDVLI